MGKDGFLFNKPISVLAGNHLTECSPYRDMSGRIKFTQNGLKINVGDESFVAKTIDEALEILKTGLEKLEKDLKKNDK